MKKAAGETKPNLMQTFKAINSAIAFFVEITMLVALGLSGYYIANHKLMQYLLLITMPLFAIIIWGIWAAPKSKQRLQRPWLTIFKLAVFSVTVMLLFQTDHLTAAIVFGTVAFLNELLAAYLLHN